MRWNNIPHLVDNIVPAVKAAAKTHKGLEGDAIIPFAIEQNVYQAIEDLFMKSAATREIVRNGSAKVVGAFYDVSTGRVNWLPENKVTQILSKVEADPKRAKNPMAGHE